MLGNRELIIDTHSEIYSMIKHHADGIFWNLKQHVEKNQIVSDAIYVIGREQLSLNANEIKQIIADYNINLVFSNPHEGSETILGQIYRYGINELVMANKILIVGGGNMEAKWPCLCYDSFLPKILDYDENLKAIDQYKENYTTDRPYKFLFLNGRSRPHRTELITRLDGLLDQCIWTNLDSTNGLPIKTLDPKYEYDHVVTSQPLPTTGFVKHELFDNKWGDVYIKENLYQDTYFSLVTETVFGYPYSFRTEKIWKPVAVGHPWIAVANAGFYKDFRNLGFQTFNHVIDESFDNIEDNNKRLDRIVQVVEDLCQQDLAAFIKECYNVCKYNQQHLAGMRQKVRQEFPERFFQFIKQYHFDE